MSVPGVWNVTQWNQSLWTSESQTVDPPLRTLTDLENEIERVIKDPSVTDDDIDQFIQRAHDKIVRDLMADEYGRSVPMQMLVRATSTTDSQSAVTKPDGFIKARSVTINGSPARYASPEKIETASPGLADGDVSMDFYQAPKRLKEPTDTNWLLEASGDVYVYGACVQYVPWSKNWENLPLWTPYYEDAMRGVKTAYGPRPRGSVVRQKSYPYSTFYTIIGDAILFGNPLRRTPQFSTFPD